MIYFAQISGILGTAKNNFEPMFSSTWASQMSHHSVPSLSSLLFPGDENMSLYEAWGTALPPKLDAHLAHIFQNGWTDLSW